MFTQCSEQIGVCTGAHQEEVVTVDLGDEQPIGFKVAVAVMLPFSGQRVIPIPGGSGAPSASSKIKSRSLDISLPRRCANFTSRRNWAPLIRLRKLRFPSP